MVLGWEVVVLGKEGWLKEGGGGFREGDGGLREDGGCLKERDGGFENVVGDCPEDRGGSFAHCTIHM